MIVTITLNPAVDQTLVVERFVAGDTVRVKASRFDPGGKGINVSRVIHELGGKTMAMGFAPGGLGRYIEQSLDSSGIPTDFLHTKGETRTNITLLDEGRRIQTILSDPGPETEPRYLDELKKRLWKRLRPGDWLVLAGSIPPPLDASVYTEIIHEASHIGVHTVLDADGAALSAGAAAHPEIVKGNRREMERLLGRHLDNEESVLEAVREVHDSGVNNVVVTRGREGAVAVADQRFFRGVAPRVRAVSAIGSGDAFLAGVVLTLSEGGTAEDALRLGIAAGTASTLFPGTELCRRREVDILMPRVKVLPVAC